MYSKSSLKAEEFISGGSLKTTEVMPKDYTHRSEGIYNITIKNIIAYSSLCCVIRLLSVNTKIHNVIIDGVIDNTPKGQSHWATVLIGDIGYGSNLKDGVSSIIINNVICNSNTGVEIKKYLKDSVISNIISGNDNQSLINVNEPDGLVNVKILN